MNLKPKFQKITCCFHLVYASLVTFSLHFNTAIYSFNKLWLPVNKVVKCIMDSQYIYVNFYFTRQIIVMNRCLSRLSNYCLTNLLILSSTIVERFDLQRLLISNCVEEELTPYVDMEDDPVQTYVRKDLLFRDRVSLKSNENGMTHTLPKNHPRFTPLLVYSMYIIVTLD